MIAADVSEPFSLAYVAVGILQLGIVVLIVAKLTWLVRARLRN